jgi:hypothetical protein
MVPRTGLEQGWGHETVSRRKQNHAPMLHVATYIERIEQIAYR